MASKPISQLPAGLPLTGTELVPAVQNNTTVHVPSSSFGTYRPSILTLTGSTYASDGVTPTSLDAVLTANGALALRSRIDVLTSQGVVQTFYLLPLSGSTPNNLTIVLPADYNAQTNNVAFFSFGNVFTLAMVMAGNLTAGQIFGYFVFPTAALITGIAAFVQAPDAEAAVSVLLANGSGTSYGSGFGATVPASDNNVFTDFSSSPLALAAGSVVRAQISAYTPSSDPSAPAQDLLLTLLCRQ